MHRPSARSNVVRSCGGGAMAALSNAFGSLRALLAVLALCALAPALARGQAAEWVARPFTTISARDNFAMVFDAARGVTVLFGGNTGASNNDTWEWDGTLWTKPPVRGPIPPARFGHAMAYDAVRGVTVLFGGGTHTSGYLSDTWEWNGIVWTRRAGLGPTARTRHSMVYDSARGVTTLFGGVTTGAVPNNETWEWNGDSWRLRAETGPSPRYGHSMTFDTSRNVAVLFGGSDGPNFLGDTWEWTGANWSQRTGAETGPAARIDNAIAFDPVRRLTILFENVSTGGSGNSLWEWDGMTWTRRTYQGSVSPRPNFRMVFDSARGATVMYGGYRTGTGSNETWELNGVRWNQRTPAPPLPRHSHAMAYDVARGVTVLFGGESGSSFADTWEWDGAGWTQRAVGGTAPWARTDHAMVYDSVRNVTVLFGGEAQSSANAETWEWNGTVWTRRLVTGPSARVNHAMAYDSARGVTVLFGGGNASFSSVSNNETWEWNGTSWTRRAVNGPAPSPRGGVRMAFDSTRNVTVLFGGAPDTASGAGASSETWEWNGAIWNQRTVAGVVPAPRFNHAMAFDTARGVTVLFGGRGGFPGYSNETWEWNGTVWARRALSGPLPEGRKFHAIAYDQRRDTLVLFGGWDIYDSTTWLRRPPCSVFHILSQPQDAMACATGTARFATTVNGIDRTFRWRKNGVALDPLVNPSSDTTRLVLRNLGEEDGGNYDCVVTAPDGCGTLITVPATLTMSTCACSVADMAGSGGPGRSPDGVVDGSDFIAFFASFNAGSIASDPLADVAGGGTAGYSPDGVIDGTDFVAFLNAFAAGC